jgi:hypothetical protein
VSASSSAARASLDVPANGARVARVALGARRVFVQPAPERLRVFVATGVVLAFAALALRSSAHTGRVDVEHELIVTHGVLAVCRAHRAQAGAHARLLEQQASASSERVPFDARESPRSVALMAEAEACFAAAQDRSGRTRAAGLRARYAADLERRVALTRLRLRVAMRSLDVPVSEPGTRGDGAGSSQIAREAATLLALLERAPRSVQPYRAELTQLVRRHAVERSPLRPRSERLIMQHRTDPARTP